jgi:transcriptional regulator with XRE-family HTH domain
MRQDWRRTVGANVRRLRKDRGLTQEDLAGVAELDVSYVRGIEAGRRNPSLMVMVALADALDAKPTDLFRRA